MATPPDSPEAAAEAQVETTTALARQSILDEKGDVFGYELFDRSTQGHHHSAQTDATVLFRVLSNAGVDALFGRKNLFINCTHESLTAPDGKPATCNDCGKVFPDCEAAHEERRELLD